MIKPTVGRIVWYWPGPDVSLGNGDQPCSATVTHVHDDRLVNLSALSAEGVVNGRTRVTLVQPGDPKPEGRDYCEWMPYQQGQAAKSEDVGGKLLAELEEIGRAFKALADRVQHHQSLLNTFGEELGQQKARVDSVEELVSKPAVVPADVPVAATSELTAKAEAKATPVDEQAESGQ